MFSLFTHQHRWSFLKNKGKNPQPLLTPLSSSSRPYFSLLFLMVKAQGRVVNSHQLPCHSLLAHKPAPTRFCISCPQNCPCPQVTSQCPNLVVTSQSLSSRSQQRLTRLVPLPPGNSSGPSTRLASLPPLRDCSVPLSLVAQGWILWFLLSPNYAPPGRLFHSGGSNPALRLMTPTVLSPSRGSPELHTRGPAASRHLHFDIDKAPQTQYVLTIPRYLRSCSSYRKWKLHHSRCSLQTFRCDQFKIYPRSAHFFPFLSFHSGHLEQLSSLLPGLPLICPPLAAIRGCL